MRKREPWESQPWDQRDHPIWGECVKTPGWPECGDGKIGVEDLYQAFKERMMAELVAQNPATVSGDHFTIQPKNYPLVPL